MKSDHTGLKRLISSFSYSMKGLRSSWQHEEAFRVECILLLIGIFTMPFIINSHIEFLVLSLAFAIVLITELLNSAIESIVDRIGPEYHELSGRAKDQGSAAVFVALCIAGLTWLGVAIY